MPFAATIITEDESLAGSAFGARVARVAAGLVSLDVRRGDCVALLLRNDTPFLEATVAAQQLGAYAVPLNWHFKRDELLYVVGDCTPKVLIVHADLLGQIESALPSSIVIIVVPTPPALRRAFRLIGPEPEFAAPVRHWAEWLAASEPVAQLAASPTDSLIYTSGTTGNPKGVRRQPPTADQAKLGEVMRATVFGIGAGDRVLVSAPLYHTAPNFFSLRAVRIAALLVIQPRFDAEAFLAAIEGERITHVYAVPTMFVRLLALPSEVRARYDLSSLRFVLHAGGPCPAAVKEQMIAWLGPVINEYYGSTEHGPLTFCTSVEWLAHRGTVGRAAPSVTIEIHDDADKIVPAGIAGEILACNTAHADFTYHGRTSERQELQRGDLVVTGDIGYLDTDGFLYLCDRKRDVVISGGVNIYPAEIEGVLAECPGVADSVVFGIPDTVFGERLLAIVQPRPGLAIDVAAVREFLAKRLASYKVPACIEVRDTLPREESGKIRKRLLREPFWKGSF